jgi:hypothetical protein
MLFVIYCEWCCVVCTGVCGSACYVVQLRGQLDNIKHSTTTTSEHKTTVQLDNITHGTTTTSAHKTTVQLDNIIHGTTTTSAHKTTVQLDNITHGSTTAHTRQQFSWTT